MEFTYAKFTEDACLRHKLISSFSLYLFLYFSEFKLLMHLKKHYAQKCDALFFAIFQASLVSTVTLPGSVVSVWLLFPVADSSV